MLAGQRRIRPDAVILLHSLGCLHRGARHSSDHLPHVRRQIIPIVVDQLPVGIGALRGAWGRGGVTYWVTD